MRLRVILFIATLVVAVVAIALWPRFVERGIATAGPQGLPSFAPVVNDYQYRDRRIAFWEKNVARNTFDDGMSPQHLATEYLQRYREDGDIQDVFRAKAMAELSLRRAPRYNIGAETTLASVDLTLHRFHEALAITQHTEAYDRNDPQLEIREASLDLELGRYADAKRLIDRLPPPKAFEVGRDIVVSRYEEMTGDLTGARTLFARPSAYANSQFDAPAQSRAWYFFRGGELAFEEGDNAVAIADEAEALTIFPHDVDASRAKARFECALHEWADCLKDAQFSAEIIPYPETLGYEADAQAALGQRDAAAQTRDLIRTVERIGNAQRISDRLLAIYYDDHDLYPGDAYRIATRELEARDDVLTEDTLAWAAAKDGRWDEARRHLALARRYGTENAVMDYHAGVIALHFGDRAEAKRDFEAALALNPQFHETFADDARAKLASL